MNTNTLTLKLAMVLLNQTRKNFADYEADCEEYAKQGFRPHYCIHGTNQWTDYDNICGGCEDGDGYWDYQRCMRNALDDAKAAQDEVARRAAVYVDLDRQHAPMHPDFFSWVAEPIERIKKLAPEKFESTRSR